MSERNFNTTSLCVSGDHDTTANTHENPAFPPYLRGGKVDMDYLIESFQDFWEKNSDILGTPNEASVHNYDISILYATMHAFLYRIVMYGGKILHGTSLSTKRAEMCVVYRWQKYPIGLTILQDEESRSDSLAQVSDYMGKVGSYTGWLVVFDRSTKPWDEKIYRKTEIVNGKKITVVEVLKNG